MRDRNRWSSWWPWAAVSVALAAGPAWGQPGPATSSPKDQANKASDDQSNKTSKDQADRSAKDQSKKPSDDQSGKSSRSSDDRSRDSGPVVRTFGAEGGYRTEVKSQVQGKLTEEEWRQASLLTAQVFQHVTEARAAVDADDTQRALKEVNKGLEAIKAIRAMLPRATVHTRTVAPDGKPIYEDDREIQQARIPLFEGMLHAQTLAPIVAARRNAMEVAGVQLVESETIVTEAIADLDAIEGQLKRAAKALQEKKAADAAKALGTALIRGLEFRYQKEDTELASARDAIWLARRALEENNVTQALVNLETARQRLKLYRELASEDQRQEVDQMLREVVQLENQLRQEKTQPATRAVRARQGSTLTSWWDKVNGWFRRHL